jgi:hypothetical protein
MSERCQNIRTAKNPKKHPGEQRTYRCRNEASRITRVFQNNEHPRVGSGWFSVALCHRCFLYESEPNASVGGDWRIIHD